MTIVIVEVNPVDAQLVSNYSMTMVMGDRYTPGVGRTAVSFMAARSAQSHAAFLLAHLSAGMSVVDVGCGPGTITVGLAEAVAPGRVLGVDQGSDQLTEARALAGRSGVTNVSFATASCYRLPVPDSSVDRVFAHALIEHLGDPMRAVAEMRRILRPGGIVALCSPDWGGFILSPPTAAVDRAVGDYTELMVGNGGDPLAGRQLARYLSQSGFENIRIDARYERYADTGEIAGYLGAQLIETGHRSAARALTDWARDPFSMFAQTWVSAVGVRR
jgi:ubiquinone/menaquinone biosynthesis C-methylase UbiE